MKRHTIKDIAREGGVSVATVTKVLRGYPDVSERTRERVSAVAKRLGYHPNRVAQALVTRSTTTIGVYLDDEGLSLAEQHFFLPAITGIRDAAARSGLHLLLIAADSSGASFIDSALELMVGGVIVMGLRREEELDSLASQMLPVVTIDIAPRGERMCMVTSDNRAAAAAATKHLLAQHCRRILYLGGKPHTLVNRERELGYRDALVAAGHTKSEALVTYGMFHLDHAIEAVSRVLFTRQIDGIFAASDLMAVGALAAVQKAGLRVPQDMAIVGFDDLPIAQTAVPPLSSIRQNPRHMGATAVAVLQSMLAGEMPVSQQVVLPAELVVRASSRRC